jgi:biotin transporter BioY
VASVAGGIIVYAVGYTGLQLLTQIIIADITTLKWRGLVSGLVNSPFIINGFVGANIASAIVSRGSWRWGCKSRSFYFFLFSHFIYFVDGMFAILVPMALAPLIVTLLWAERKARIEGLINTELQPTPTTPTTSTTLMKPLSNKDKILKVASQLDVFGLLLLGGGVSCILLPLTLAKTASKGWKNRSSPLPPARHRSNNQTASMIAMLVVRFVLVLAFLIWELYVASHPVSGRTKLLSLPVSLGSLTSYATFLKCRSNLTHSTDRCLSI